MQSRLLNELCAHHQIVVKETSWIFLIVPYSTDNRSQVDDQLRICISQQALYVCFLYQIIIPTSWDHDLNTRIIFQHPDHEATKKAGSSSYNYLFVRKF